MPNLTNLKEIKKLVDNSKNPFFLFDEDWRSIFNSVF